MFQPGDRCGRYEIVRRLGTGGFAQVYEARDPSGAPCALKTLATDAGARPKLRARAAQEAAALAMIDHPHVVRLLDSGFHEDRIFLALELVAGDNLRTAVSRGAGAATITRWIRDAADGVAEAHGLGVIHRDLKPENLLVDVAGTLKVIDFGIAKLSSWGVKTSNQQRLGTALYMAPEQIQGVAPDARMDVYALGLVLYEALAGAHPITADGATIFEICARQLHHRPRPFASAAPWAPAALAALIDAAIEKDPDRRPPTMRAFADALGEVLPSIPDAPPRAPDPDATTPLVPARSIADVPPPSRVRPPALTALATPLSPSEELGPTAPLARPVDSARGRPEGRRAPEPTTEDTADQTTAMMPVRARRRRGRKTRPTQLAAALVAAFVGTCAGVWIVEGVLAALRARVVGGPATTTSAASATRPQATPGDGALDRGPAGQ